MSHEDFEWGGDDFPSVMDEFVPINRSPGHTVDSNILMMSVIYDFMAYITTLPEVLMVGSSEDCTPLMRVFGDWAQSRGLDPSAEGIIPNIRDLRSTEVMMEITNAQVRDEVIRHLLDPLRDVDREHLREIADGLKWKHVGHWAVGEMLERTVQYLDLEIGD